MKKFIATTLLVIGSTYGFSQDLSTDLSVKMLDSLKFMHLQRAAIKYPAIRQAAISTDIVSKTSAHSELYDQTLYNGKEQIIRVKAHFTVPVVSWKQNTISATIGITKQYLDLSNVTSGNTQITVKDTKLNLTSFAFQTNYIRSDSLFNKPLTFGVAVSGTTNDSFDKLRLVYSGFTTLNLMRNPVSSFSVGFALISDPSSLTPFIPLISYSRKFTNIGVELLADMPSRIILRKELSTKNFLSVGSELTGNSFLFNFNQPGIPKDAVSTTLIIKSGLTFERLLSKNVIVGISGGLFTSPSSKVMATNAKSSDYFIKTKSINQPYLNLSISFLPFWKGLKL